MMNLLNLDQNFHVSQTITFIYALQSEMLAYIYFGVYLFCSKISASFHLQKAAEMREKIKILQNEIEILRSKVNAKDRFVRLNVS